MKRAADHSQREHHDRVARWKRAAVELTDVGRHQSTRNTSEKTGESDSHYLIGHDIDAHRHRDRLAAADQSPGTTGARALDQHHNDEANRYDRHDITEIGGVTLRDRRMRHVLPR